MSKIHDEITILTVTYKSDHLIDQCLANLDKKFKTIVVENSNNKLIKEHLEKRKNTKCILSGSNLGFGSAFNIGAKNINTKFIFHLNPDVFINTDTIHKLYKISKNIENLGIISPIEENKTNIEESKLIEVNHVKGFAMLINNFNCRETNYFDENFFLYLEEIDLCKRLLAINKKIFLTSDIKVKHLGGMSHNPIFSKNMEKQRNWHYMWSLYYFNKKHFGFRIALKSTLRKFISAFLKMVLFYFINKDKFDVYKYRFLGLLNSYLGKKSSFRI